MRAKQILAFLALTLCFGSEAFAAAPVQKREITETRATYSLEVSYPRTGHNAVDAVLEAWAKGVARDFLEMAKDATQEPAPSGSRPSSTTRSRSSC